MEHKVVESNPYLRDSIVETIRFMGLILSDPSFDSSEIFDEFMNVILVRKITNSFKSLSIREF